MNSIERRYAEFDPDWMLLDRASKSEVVKMTVLYLMRAVTSQEYSDHVREVTKWSGNQMSDFRNNLKFCGYLQRDFKFYLYEAIVDGTYTFSSRIHKTDRTFVKGLIESKDEYTKALLKQCKAYHKLGYVARNLNVFTKKCDGLVEDLDLYCKKFVLEKLKFVVQQNAMTISDMVNELMCYGFYSIFRAYPEIQNNLHMLNIAKQAIHNRGMNVIKENTTQSRSRLTRNQDGTFSAKVISLQSDQLGLDPAMLGGPTSGGMLVCTSLMANLEGNSAENEKGSDVDSQRDLRQTIDTLLEEIESDKAKKFIELLMGEYDPLFSAWLNQDNDEFYETATRQEYAEKVRRYLGVSVEKARRFVQGLRAELRDFVA